MGKIGKISAIKKRYPADEKSISATLSNTYNKNRFPGTATTKMPYKQGDGSYRTGLEDKKEERERLEKLLRIDLSPRSDYYNYRSEATFKVNPIRLRDDDNIFNLDDPEAAVTYYWLSAHPTIASSWEDWEAGRFPSDTQFYVNNDNLETERQYKKDVEEAQAISKLMALSPDKLRKVARLLGYPVAEDQKPELIFPILYSFIKEGIIKSGPYKNMNSITKFNQVADLSDTKLHINDQVEKALRYNIFRLSTGGRIMKGDVEVAKSKEDFIEHISSSAGQDTLLLMEKDIKAKESLSK